MGNKNSNKKVLDTKNLINKSFTLCPLIKNRKLIIEKKFFSTTISCIGIITYKNKDFILVGYDYAGIEIFDSETLESVVKDHNEINVNEYIRYVGHLINEDFIVVSQDYIRIYSFYSDNISNSLIEEKYYYKIKLVQKIEDPFIKKNLINNSKVRFSKAFLFNRNLYREYDLYEMGLDKIRRKKNNSIITYPIDEELIVSSYKGIFIYEKNKIESNEGTEDYSNKEENEEIKKFDIYSHLEKWDKNPYIFREQITKDDIYDMIQVNFKYIAGTIKSYLCLYSMETYELVTKFSVKISEQCDSVIYMLKEDILCVAGDDTISLISIKDFEVVLVSKIKNKYKITEICILPDHNILIGMQNKNKIFLENHIEYFYQYKCIHSVNKLTKRMEYDIIQVSSKLLTKNYSNITMKCLNNNRLVTVIDLELMQVWE